MAFGCGAKLAKCILFVFNAIFWLCGLALVICGIILLLSPKITLLHDLVGDVDSSLKSATYVFIVLGSLISLIGFTGCCGAIRESVCLLICYAFFLTILLIAQIIISIILILSLGTVKSILSAEFKKKMQKYPPMDSKNVEENTKNTIDQFQSNYLMCCGQNSYQDWKDTNWYTNQSKSSLKYSVPPSCCKDIGFPDYDMLKYRMCATDLIPKNIYQDGCAKSLETYMDSNYPLIIAFSILVAIVELVGIFLAICLCSGIRRELTVQRRAV